MNAQTENASVMIVPGFKGNDEAHWQNWLHGQLPGSRVLCGVNWNEPVLAEWAERVREEIPCSNQPLWIVAHSFGCLATAVAVADRPGNVAGVIFVAPADPGRFNLLGLGVVDDPRLAVKNLTEVLPGKHLDVGGLVIASDNDPWMPLSGARHWASQWGLEFMRLRQAGHINTESGFGPWPMLHDLLVAMREEAKSSSAQKSSGGRKMPRGRGSVLAQVRKHTRNQIGLLTTFM